MARGEKIIIQGHRGARGLYPENTLSAFIGAVKTGVRVLEMDVVISKDQQIVVSHEPWMNPVFCSAPDGKPLPPGSEKEHNLYQMPYSVIKTYDCGKRRNPGFPFQKAIPEYKPLLSEVIIAVETYVKENQLSPVTYNIEIKSEPEGDDLYHPKPDAFAHLVLKGIKQLNIHDRFFLQSFDTRILQNIHGSENGVKIGFLTEDEGSIETHLSKLGFLPYTYNPEYHLINEASVRKLHELNIQIAAWTVNETSEMKKLINMGVDSIITDYPDKAIALIK